MEAACGGDGGSEAPGGDVSGSSCADQKSREGGVSGEGPHGRSNGVAGTSRGLGGCSEVAGGRSGEAGGHSEGLAGASQGRGGCSEGGAGGRSRGPGARLHYAHLVVLDDFVGEAERSALLDFLTAPGWEHAQVRAHRGFQRVVLGEQQLACHVDRLVLRHVM